MTAGQLIEVDAKVKQAKQHVRELTSAIRAFIESEPYEIATYDEDETGDQVYKVHVRSELPITFSAILGDILNNLRSALDYLVFALAEGKGSAQLSFPIRNTPEDFEREIQKIEKFILRSEAMELLRATQAYKGGNGHGLWELHQLNRREKHRFLIPVGVANAQVAVNMPTAMMEMMQKFRRPLFHPGIFNTKPANRVFPLKEGTEIYRLLAQGRGGNVGNNPKFTFEIAFGEGEILKGDPILPKLAQYTKLVEGTVKPFRPLFS